MKRTLLTAIDLCYGCLACETACKEACPKSLLSVPLGHCRIV